MSKILSDEMYEQAGKEIDEKLAPMQKIIFEKARKKSMSEMEFEEGKQDPIEDLEAARNAIQAELVKFNISPIFIHYTVILRALNELITIRKYIDKKKQE
jgi:hypothetical protein